MIYYIDRSSNPPSLDGKECIECFSTNKLTYHHVVPVVRGGTACVILCGACHAKAHHRSGNMSTSALTREALARKKARGERVGQIPYGSQLAADGVHLEDEPAEQGVIRRILALREQGVSYRRIARQFNEEGVPARGLKWHPTTIVRIVKAASDG